MYIQKNIDLPKVFLHIGLGFCSLLLYHVGVQGEPYSLALAYAAQTAGLNPIVIVIAFLFSTLVWGNSKTFLLYFCQSVLLIGAFLLQKKVLPARLRKFNLLPMLSLSFCLGGFIAFAPFEAYALPLSLVLDAIVQKIFLSAGIFLLSACFSVALKALLRKLLKCRLYNDEIVFSSLLFLLCGFGFCRIFSVNAYLGVAFFILFVFSYVTKDAYVLLCAFLLSLPPFFIARYPISKFFTFGAITCFLVPSGKLITICGFLCVFFTFGCFDGLYTLPTPFLVQSVLSAVLPCLLFILFPTSILKAIENKLVFYREKHLNRIAINRNRFAVGEKLYELSAVFREIECTFSALGSNEAEQGAKEYIRGCVIEEVCKNCSHHRICQQKNVQADLDVLVDIGCLKGRTSLLDMPKSLVNECIQQSFILNAVNKQLHDYRRYMTESENAASGRALLANQAQGISEILKNLALEQSQPLRIYTDKERALNAALLNVGIVCSEVLVYGEENNLTLSLITYGNADVKKISRVASHVLETNMMISEKLNLSDNKFCCILRKKPYFDAAFGVATTKKVNATASGDTHSILKIDERTFMVALSDGMGSGEYARRISESTISLLESFYRAKMPSALVLSTINKLLSFSKEETFACVDIAIVNLDDGNADIVKIGSPYGFILTGGTVKVLEGSSLPLGILDSIHPDTSGYRLAENDVLLFLSDGITDAFGSTADLYEALKCVPIRNPQQLVDELLRQAIDRYGGEAKDDMTAIAVRLFKSLDVI